MTLKHELCFASVWVPKLDTPVLGSRKYPSTIRRQCNTEHKIVVAFEDLDALATLWSSVAGAAIVRLELPHTNSPVQTAGNEILARG